MSLFNFGNFVLHSVGKSNFKIDCDFLSDEDLENLAKLVYDNYGWGSVYGVPTGGIRFARILSEYSIENNPTVLIVDDVLTTGRSMEEAKRKVQEKNKNLSVTGIVIFARDICPEWVVPIFKLNNKDFMFG